MRTRGVGHPYTNGTADSNETWVSLEAAADGRRFFASGVLDEKGQLDAGADRLWTLVVDDNGGHMDRRQPQDIRVPLYNNGIGPGAARVVHYRMTVPKDARGTVELSAGTHYRKFTRDYTTFSLGAAQPSLPVTTLASDTVALRVAGGGGAPSHRRRQARQPRPTLAALERLRDRPLPPGRPQGRGRRVDESRGARPGQARRAPQPRPGRDRGRPPRRRQGVARGSRAAAAGLGQDGLLPRRSSPRTRAASTTPSGT